jgi:hypothetical protein
MYVIELLANKKNLDMKIKELERILKYEQTDALAQELFALLEQRQSVLMDLDNANHAGRIKIGTTEITTATAIVLRNTLKAKMAVLTSLINNKDCTLDKLELQTQRDKHFEEYFLLSMAINRNDLQVTMEN